MGFFVCIIFNILYNILIRKFRYFNHLKISFDSNQLAHEWISEFPFLMLGFFLLFPSFSPRPFPFPPPPFLQNILLYPCFFLICTFLYSLNVNEYQVLVKLIAWKIFWRIHRSIDASLAAFGFFNRGLIDTRR